MENLLISVLQEEIARNRVISFARFMEIALYYPGFGYYRRKADDIFGSGGDFYTAGQLQPVWGELLASFVRRLYRASGDPSDFAALDLGAGRQDLGDALRPWNYRPFDWDTEPLPEKFSGVVIANEFFDALPVHLLGRRKSRWCELMVESMDGKFVFKEQGEISAPLSEYAERYGPDAEEGQLMEVCLAAAEWMDRIGALLGSGDVLIMDYGYDARELCRYPEGTLVGFKRHAVADDFLSEPGRRDITAHVNFSYLRDLAIRAGLEIVGESSLAQWAMNIWGEDELSKRWKESDDRWRMLWKHLVFGMGWAFRVLHLRKENVGREVATK